MSVRSASGPDLEGLRAVAVGLVLLDRVGVPVGSSPFGGARVRQQGSATMA